MKTALLITSENKRRSRTQTVPRGQCGAETLKIRCIHFKLTAPRWQPNNGFMWRRRSGWMPGVNCAVGHETAGASCQTGSRLSRWSSSHHSGNVLHFLHPREQLRSSRMKHEDDALVMGTLERPLLHPSACTPTCTPPSECVRVGRGVFWEEVIWVEYLFGIWYLRWSRRSVYLSLCQ